MKKDSRSITVLAVLIMIALGTAAVLQSVGNQTIMKSNNIRDVQAQYFAEAGMEYALWQCRTSAGVCINNPTYTIDGTTVTASINVRTVPPGSPVYEILVQVLYSNV